MSLKFINNAGKQYLVVNNYKFRENRTLANGNISWRCCAKDCNSWVKTDSRKSTIIDSKHVHKHNMQCPSSAATSSTPRARPVSTSAPLLKPSTSTPAPMAVSVVDASSLSPAPSPPAYSSNTPTIVDYENENISLKAEVARLKSEMKVVLDHSIESDQRLLQYTDDIFSVGTISIVNSLSCNSKHMSTQTDDDFNAVSGNVEKAKHLQERVTLEQELKSAINKIKNLEEVINVLNVPCEKCAILKSETKNMIGAIKILETENKTLKQNINVSESKDKETANPTSIALSNRYQLLSNDKSHDEDFQTVTYKKTFYKKRKNNKEEIRFKVNKAKKMAESTSINKVTDIKFRSVSIIGDSHVRHLAENVSKRITPNTRVTGTCKPNAGVLQILPTSDPPPNHCYVVLGGTNDVDADRQDIIYDHYEDLIKQCGKKSRVIVCPLFPRYDLPASSPIHGAISRANTYISRVCSRNDGSGMLDISGMNRHHFTSHGMHLRACGKRFLSNIIVESLSRVVRAPCCMTEEEATTSDARPTPPTVVNTGLELGLQFGVEPQDLVESRNKPTLLQCSSPSQNVTFQWMDNKPLSLLNSTRMKLLNNGSLYFKKISAKPSLVESASATAPARPWGTNQQDSYADIVQQGSIGRGQSGQDDTYGFLGERPLI